MSRDNNCEYCESPNHRSQDCHYRKEMIAERERASEVRRQEAFNDIHCPTCGGLGHGDDTCPNSGHLS